MTADEPSVLRSLEGVHRTSKGWSARCPAHEDKHNSLSVSMANDGKVLMHCHAGCAYRNITAALGGPTVGQARRDKLAKGYASAVEAALETARRQRGSLAGEWTYHDASGAHAFNVIRINLDGGAKSFRPVRRGGDGWVISYPPGLRPLYRLPQIRADSQPTVYVTEGEKACEAAAQLGLVTTTSACGAKQARKTDWTPLAGRSVVILPDNDDPGRAYGREVAGILAQLSPPASVRIVELPGLPAAGDIVEFMEARQGQSAEEIRAEIESIPEQSMPAARPLITHNAGDMHESVRAAIGVLARDGRVYQRSHALVTIVADGASKAGGIERDGGAPVISPVSGPRLTELLCEMAQWRKYDARKEEYVDCSPPKDVVASVLERREWDEIPELRGVVTAPVMRPDGSILSTPGYDKHTGLYFAPGGIVPEIASSPTLEDARVAAQLLIDAAADFPFASDEDRSAWLAAALSPLALPAIDNAPMFVVDAPTPGTGKTLSADLISMVATGHRMARSPYPGKSDEEMRKRITAHAIAGDALILIDNVPSGAPVGWASLDSALTGSEWSDRILGRSENTRLPFKAVWFATGNNLCVSADAARRTIKIRLATQEERPEERSGFKHDPLLPWAAAERGRLLAAALTILRAYVVAGRPAANVPPLGSFERWSGLVRAAILWLGLPDPVARSAARDPDVDPERAAHAQALLGWLELDPGSRGITVTEAIKEIDAGRAIALNEALGELCPSRDGKLTARTVGYKLRALRGRPRTIETKAGPTQAVFESVPDRNGVGRWLVRVDSLRGMRGIEGHISSPTRGVSETHDLTLHRKGPKDTRQSPAYPAGEAQSYEEADHG